VGAGLQQRWQRRRRCGGHRAERQQQLAEAGSCELLCGAHGCLLRAMRHAFALCVGCVCGCILALFWFRFVFCFVFAHAEVCSTTTKFLLRLFAALSPASCTMTSSLTCSCDYISTRLVIFIDVTHDITAHRLSAQTTSKHSRL
jgi:hypothetical protein